MSLIELNVGESVWPFRVADNVLVEPRPQSAAPGLADLPSALHDALEHPYGHRFPLRRALTPDDRIALVVDEQLPQLGALLTELLRYLASAGIGPDSVTILTASSSGGQEWIDELPDEFADVRTENHQPGDRKLLSYLATTKKGRRVYLNRTLVDADQIIVLSGRRYDALLGYSGGEGSLFPALSDAETRLAMWEELTTAAPTPEPSGVRAEAMEIAFLLGSPIYIQAVEGSSRSIAYLVAGLIDSAAQGVKALDERWRFTIPEPVDVVLAALGGGHLEFAALARAALCASRAVKEDGVIVILTDAEPALGEGIELIRRAEEPRAALKLLGEKKPADMVAAFSWVSSARHARIYLASGLRPEIVEEIFATPILSPNEVQRLLDLGGTCLVLPDADKSLVVVERHLSHLRDFSA